MSTDVLERPSLGQTGNEEKLRHRFRKSDLMRYYVEGGFIEALCGKKHQPTTESSDLPLCVPCKEIYDLLT